MASRAGRSFKPIASKGVSVVMQDDEQLQEALIDFATAAHRITSLGGLERLIEEVKSLLALLLELERLKRDSLPN